MRRRRAISYLFFDERPLLEVVSVTLKSLVESLSLSEALTTVATFYRSFEETLSLSEVFSGSAIAQVGISLWKRLRRISFR